MKETTVLPRALADGALPRSRLAELQAPGAFRWSTGIEDTFITAPAPRTGRALDEYALTDHYARTRADQELIAALGVGTARYGLPWHKINPERDRWDWDWTDRALNGLLELGVDPIVDLVHYGTPAWLQEAFLNPDYPNRVAEYARRAADRYKGRIFWYTPLNEPRITAWYCGRLGWWPPFHRGWSGFVRLMLAIVRGIVATAQSLQSVDPEIVLVHVDATDLYTATDPGLADQARLRQEIVFLALDLLSGRVKSGHPLYDWLLKKGATAQELDWFRERPVDLDLVGLNMYPMFTNKALVRSARGLRVRMPYGSPDIVDRLGEMYWSRYRRPIMITETAGAGSFARRGKWLAGSVAAVRRLRERGVPVVGYTWWPLYSLVAWAFRQGTREIGEYLLDMGLWDLRAGDLARVPTPLVEQYQQLVAAGAGAVGAISNGGVSVADVR